MSIGPVQLSKSCAIALLAALMFAGCGGDSAEEKAMSSVCEARADIDDQVKQLAGLTASTVTADKVSQSLEAIGGDLTKIKDAQGDLADDRKAEVEDANQAFTATVKSTLSELGTSVSAGDAKAALTSATQKLGDSYQQTFAPIDCG
jgi:hypothetical protein